MRIRAILAMATAVSATSAAPVPKELARQAEKDKRLIVGEWRDGAGATVLFGTGGVTARYPGSGPFDLKEWFTIKPLAYPKAIDLLGYFGREEPKRGIYKLDSDTLTICLNERPGGERPTEFEAGAGVIVLTLTRVPDAEPTK